MGYIIGIDQGGSKTAAVVSDREGNLLGLGKSAGSCYFVRGMEHAMNAIMEACNNALVNAGLAMTDVDTVMAGLTGADWPFEYDLLCRELRKTAGIENVTIYNDSVIAMRGGTENPYGAAICAGSSLNVCIISPQREVYAFGYYIDQEYCGGGALGLSTLRSVFAAEAGITGPTALTEALLQFYGIDNVDKLMFKYSNSQLPGNPMDLAPLLFEVANTGDTVAIEILKRFGAGTARYVAAGLRKYGMLELECDIVLTGSVFKSHNTALIESICDTLYCTAPMYRLVEACYEPVVGAILLGLDKLNGKDLHNKIKQNIRLSSIKLGLIRKKGLVTENEDAYVARNS